MRGCDGIATAPARLEIVEQFLSVAEVSHVGARATRAERFLDEPTVVGVVVDDKDRCSAISVFHLRILRAAPARVVRW